MNQKEISTSDDIEKLDQNASELGLGGHLAPEKSAEDYRQRMKDRKNIQRKRLKLRNEKKGLIIVFTGEGKGKTTASLGMALRTIGHGDSVAIIQFIKGGWNTGEAKALEIFGESLKFHALGDGFTWETQDREKDKELVEKSWTKSMEYLQNSKFKLVILDEINIAIKLGYISLEKVIKGINERPTFTHVALTGRHAPAELIDKADLVTEMKLVHHPFKEKGIKAQKGIEF